VALRLYVRPRRRLLLIVAANYHYELCRRWRVMPIITRQNIPTVQQSSTVLKAFNVPTLDITPRSGEPHRTSARVKHALLMDRIVFFCHPCVGYPRIEWTALLESTKVCWSASSSHQQVRSPCRNSNTCKMLLKYLVIAVYR